MTVNTSKCATCSHPNRQQIDLALVAGIACRSVARQYGLSPDSVQRHRNSHLPAALLRGREAEEIACARVLVEQVGALHKRTLATLTEAERTGQLRTVMTAIREARRNLELLVRVQVRSQAGPVQDLASSPEWLAVRAGILRTLEPYPEARYRRLGRDAPSRGRAGRRRDRRARRGRGRSDGRTGEAGCR